MAIRKYFTGEPDSSRFEAYINHQGKVFMEISYDGEYPNAWMTLSIPDMKELLKDLASEIKLYESSL